MFRSRNQSKNRRAVVFRPLMCIIKARESIPLDSKLGGTQGSAFLVCGFIHFADKIRFGFGKRRLIKASVYPFSSLHVKALKAGRKILGKSRRPIVEEVLNFRMLFSQDSEKLLFLFSGCQTAICDNITQKLHPSSQFRGFFLKCLKSKRFINDIEKAKAEVSTERIKLRTCLHKMDVL